MLNSNRMRAIARLAALTPVLVACFCLLAAQSQRSILKEKKDWPDGPPDAPYEPTPPYVVKKMLELAQVSKHDLVYDLGSGDGRIVIMAAQLFGARAVGVELRNSLYKKSSERIRELGLQKRAKVVHGDIFATDFSSASVVTIYTLPIVNRRLGPVLEKKLPPGTRVVCHDYGIPGWKPEKVLTLPAKKRDPHVIYLYRRP